MQSHPPLHAGLASGVCQVLAGIVGRCGLRGEGPCRGVDHVFERLDFSSSTPMCPIGNCMNRPHCGLFLSGRLAKGEQDAIGVNKNNVRKAKIHDPVSMVKATASTVSQITGGSGGGRGSDLVSGQASTCC